MLPNPQDPSSSSAHKGRKQLVGLTPYRENALRHRLRKSAPSEPWVDAQIKILTDRRRGGHQIVYRYYDPYVFPPGGENTKMIRCPECGVLTPPNAFEHGKCLDHARHEGWGPSPSAVAIRALQKFHLRLIDCELEPEDKTSLRKEIRAFRRNTARKAKIDTNL